MPIVIMHSRPSINSAPAVLIEVSIEMFEKKNI